MNKRFIVFVCRMILTVIFFTIIGFTLYAMSQFNVDDVKATTEELKSISITEALEDEQAISTEVTTEEVTEATTEVTTEVTTEATTEEVTEATTEAVKDAAPEVVYTKPAEPVVEAVVNTATTTDAEEETEAESDLQFAGTYQITAYPASGNPCADGVFPQLGYTASCNDPALWHKWIYIEGLGNYYVHDRGSIAVMGYDTVDIYMGDRDTCIQFGRRSANVYLID